MTHLRRAIEAWKRDSDNGLHHEPWPIAPHLLEDIYTAADAVVEGSLMITLLKHCDRVRSASRAQLVNVIAPIMAEENGPAWRQTIFYPFAVAARAARGDAYVPAVSSPKITTASYGEVDAIEAVVTWDETTRTGLLLAVNRDLGAAHDVTVSLAGLPGVGSINGTDGTGVRVTAARMLHSDDPYLTNTAEHPDAVVPVDLDPTADLTADTDGTLHLTMPAVSWVAVEFTA